MNAITLYNNLSFSVAVLVLLSSVIHANKRKYVVAFIIISLTGTLFTFAAQWIMSVNTLLLTLCFVKSRKTIYKTLGMCLTVIIFSWCAIATVSSTIMLIAPNWLYTDGYNLFMGGMLIAIAIAVKKANKLLAWCRDLEHEGYVIVLEFAILLFFSFVLPRYYPAIAVESARQWGIFVLSFIFVLVIVGLLVNRVKDLEHKKRELSAKMESQKVYSERVNSQFDKVVTLNHYYNKLYQSIAPFIRNDDMTGLRQYFERHISPIHQGQIENAYQLSGIKSEIIRNLVDVTIGQATIMENISLDVDIFGEINIPEDIAFDVFELMCNLIDNALHELTEQESGLLWLGLRDVEGQLSIQIANTLTNDVNIEEMYVIKPKSEHGYGLNRVREIVYEHPSINHSTYKEGSFEGKAILVQQIGISLEGDW